MVIRSLKQTTWKNPQGFSEIWSVWHTTYAQASSELWESPECHSSWSCAITEERVSEEHRCRSDYTDPTEPPKHPLLMQNNFLLNLEARRSRSAISNLWHRSQNTFRCKDQSSGSRCCRQMLSACQWSTTGIWKPEKDWKITFLPRTEAFLPLTKARLLSPH